MKSLFYLCFCQLKKMEKNKENLFVFKSTGRKFSTQSMNCIFITDDEQIRYGYDGYVELLNEEGERDSELEFTLDEKKELAVYMIDKWSKFGSMNNDILNK